MDYYVSLLGDDSNLGTSETCPWQSIERVNTAELLPGDTVLFHANQTFPGSLRLQSSRHTPCAVTLSSYGSGRATIDSGEGAGFVAKNRGDVHLSELNFIGAGASENVHSGILFLNTLPGGIKLGDIRIHRVDVSGFKHSGIHFVAEPPDQSWSGFRDVSITYTTSHDNGDAGISCIGVW
ncbi:MAG: hypothetical protein OXI61_19760 [Candidatus Poribacteria bacterium]|nr:hypothetical protein [Candidatus Poribacteria bacterium]